MGGITFAAGDWVKVADFGDKPLQVVAAGWGIIKVRVVNGYLYFKESEVLKI